MDPNQLQLSGLRRHRVRRDSRSVTPCRRSIDRLSVSGACLLSTMIACGTQVPQWCESPDGVAAIVVARSSRSGAPRLREIWEAKPDSGRGLRGPIAVAVEPTSGMIAVADHVMASIDFIAPGGGLVARWARAGTGRGGLSTPAALDWSRDGTLAVLDLALRKVIRLDSHAQVVDEVELASGFEVPDWWVMLRGSDVMGVTSPVILVREGGWRGRSERRAQMPLLRASDFGAVIDTLLIGEVRLEPGGATSWRITPDAAVPAAAFLGGAHVVVGGDIAEFRIRVTGPMGETNRVLCMVTPALPRSELERRAGDEPDIAQAERSVARIVRLLSDGGHRILVQRSWTSGAYLQDRWFGPLGGTYDVLDLNGTYLGEVRAPRDTRIAAVNHDTVIGLRYGSTGRVSVVAFTLGWY